MNLAEYARHDALGLGELVRRRLVKPSELADLALSAIDRLNPTLNAVIETYRDRSAAADAQPTDARAFPGVPFLLKDIACHDAGALHEMGSRLAKGLRTPHATDLAMRFRASGVTILGRSNVPELGCSSTTEPVLYGPTRNPWDPTRSPGGSSGGAAAAVAAGIVPFAHANDGGGSIRVPAAACGLVGLKPSRNLNPVGPDTGLALGGFSVEHIVSRSVRDTAAMLDVTAGPGVGEWYFTPKTTASYLAETLHPPGRLRIALNLTPWVDAPLDPEVKAAIEDVARLCESLGHHVEIARFALDTDALLRCNAVIWASYLVGLIDSIAAATGRTPSLDTLETTTLSAYERGKTFSAADLIAAIDHANVVARTSGAFFTNHDVMLMPTMPQPAFKLGTLNANDPALSFDDWLPAIIRSAPFGQVFNMTGQPAITLPLAMSSDGLPIGAMFAARLAEEPLLIRLASQLEAARPWQHRVPKLFAGAL